MYVGNECYNFSYTESFKKIYFSVNSTRKKWLLHGMLKKANVYKEIREVF